MRYSEENCLPICVWTETWREMCCMSWRHNRHVQQVQCNRTSRPQNPSAAGVSWRRKAVVDCVETPLVIILDQCPPSQGFCFTGGCWVLTFYAKAQSTPLQALDTALLSTAVSGNQGRILTSEAFPTVDIVAQLSNVPSQCNPSPGTSPISLDDKPGQGCQYSLAASAKARTAGELVGDNTRVVSCRSCLEHEAPTQ